MFENFTRRHRLDYLPNDLQYEHIPSRFRFDLFKLLQEQCGDETSGAIQEYFLYSAASISISSEYALLPTADEILEHYSSDLFVDLLMRAQWHEVLSIIECLVNKGPLTAEDINDLFAFHNRGYEVEEATGVARVVVRYTTLIAENDKVLSSDIPFKPVIDAISSAKQALVNPEEIDVASSISHSVSAVEAYLRGWLGMQGIRPATLGEAIRIVKKKSLCPAHIVESLEHFYIYRNRSENVGHGAPTFGIVTREDALLCNEMAVSFINYFHRKSVPDKAVHSEDPALGCATSISSDQPDSEFILLEVGDEEDLQRTNTQRYSGFHGGRLIARILWATMAGFFGDVVITGILEARGHRPIEVGSDMFSVLFALCTLVAWVSLSTSGALTRRSVVRVGWRVARIFYAVMAGFVGSVMVAAVLQSGGHSPIELGSDMFSVLFALCTLVAWVSLSTSGALTRRRFFQAGWRFTRLLLAAVAGFVGSAIVTGALKVGGHRPVESGSDMSFVVFVLCTLVAWAGLSAIRALKTKA